VLGEGEVWLGGGSVGFAEPVQRLRLTGPVANLAELGQGLPVVTDA
jgi:hypothetical protein